MAEKITPQEKDYSQWYNDIIKSAGLAEHSAVKGCMIIKPHGYAIWEKIQNELDNRFKETGHQNAYFPLFVPKSFLSREAKHVEGFAKEAAVVTHYRLKANEAGNDVVVDPEAKLDEELIVRPTSETIIWDSYKDWIQSYRDLPLLINQWSNVVRWEMRTRLFLRTSEFLWQEGHTAHAAKEEAIEEAEKMLEVYRSFVEDYMAIPILTGIKGENEKFAGAETTYCMEAMMQDKKALQAGTSHFLGQNFAKAFDVTFANKEGNEEYVWATSWGVSTRLVGGLVMTHSDNQGLVLPPKLAPLQVVIVPIYKNEDQFSQISEKAKFLRNTLREKGYTVMYDDDDKKKPGWKFSEHEVKGVPVRIAIGPKDLEKDQAEVARRDTGEKTYIPFDQLETVIPDLLDQIQDNLFRKAKAFQENNTHYVEHYEEFKQVIEEQGGFVYAHWDGTIETEEKIKEETKASIRLIPFEKDRSEAGQCIYTGNHSPYRVVFAKAY